LFIHTLVEDEGGVNEKWVSFFERLVSFFERFRRNPVSWLEPPVGKGIVDCFAIRQGDDPQVTSEFLDPAPLAKE
jgi:hypothetical protein